MLVVLLIFIIAIFVGYALMRGINFQHQRIYAQVFSRQGARSALDQISRDILNASLIYQGSTATVKGHAYSVPQQGNSGSELLFAVPDREDNSTFTVIGYYLQPKNPPDPGFPNARQLIKQGAVVALGSDYNAGSCFSESMPAAISIACLKMKMTPEEAINAATINSAFALNRQKETGSIETGKKADLLVLDLDDYREFPYHLGTSLVKAVFKQGNQLYG